MNIKNIEFDSYCINGTAEGCRHCVQGKKLVLFISGICGRNCWYCSLSRKRKNKNMTFANERKCNSIKEVLDEIKESKATGTGITGGDPLLCLNKTVKFASELKKKLGKRFHIHIYLPTKEVTEEKLKKLSKCVDEVRFHPEFLVNANKTSEDIKKIRLAKKFFGVENIGIELPMIPDRKEEILDFIIGTEEDISFVNLNEFELSETNFEKIIKNYELKEGGYVIKESLEAGKWILKELGKRKTKLKVHLCTAELKNSSQFRNRLKRHKILPYGKRTEEGTVVYLVAKSKLKIKGTFYDKEKNRSILSENVARKLLKENKTKVFRIEEFPTSDRIETEEEELKLTNEKQENLV